MLSGNRIWMDTHMSHEYFLDIEKKYPLVLPMQRYEEVFWQNPGRLSVSDGLSGVEFTMQDVEKARARMEKFSGYISENFPDTMSRGGLIESDIVSLKNMQNHMDKLSDREIPGHLLLKLDSHLPIAGSIKARGGIYEILFHAESLALGAGILSEGDDYRIFSTKKFRDFFSAYSIAVASTGNLGLAIGIIGRAVGFEVNVHMSEEASTWKKALLVEHGVNITEHSGDYSSAVAESRRVSGEAPSSYFVDDENSRLLFLGYAVAGLRLKEQLTQLGHSVDERHPLFVYLPCGVGGAPGGVTLGLKLAFGDHVRCFWAEPTHSPSMLLGMHTGLHHDICVNDIGVDNKTGASGLAVGRPSGFVGQMMSHLLDGIYTVNDQVLYDLLISLYETENIFLEPSALAGMVGPYRALDAGVFEHRERPFDQHDTVPLHLIWGTGGGMVPKPVMLEYLSGSGEI